MQKLIFCANCQAETPHEGAVDQNGEFVFTCPTEGCGRFVKFPTNITKKDFIKKVAQAALQNVGQVSIEAQEAKLADLLSEDNEPEAVAEDHEYDE